MANQDYQELVESIIQFRDDRDWEQFHKIKDLLLGLNIEVAELQELFLWKSEDEAEQVDKKRIGEELADVFVFLTYLSKHYDIDLLEAVKAKIEANNKKYPVDKSFGSSKKYNEL